MAGQAGRLTVVALAGALLAAAGPAAPDPIGTLAGRYSHHFRNGNVDGGTGWNDDVLEIAPVGDRRAYFRLELNFFNGHVCALSGIARASGATLVYTDPSAGWDGQHCRMKLYRRGDVIRMDDNGGTCQATCGSRGGYASAALPWSSRRPITYLARLKASHRYRAALAEWQR